MDDVSGVVGLALDVVGLALDAVGLALAVGLAPGLPRPGPGSVALALDVVISAGHWA